MSSESAIKVTNLSKHYLSYRAPADRLWQMLLRGRKQFYTAHEALKSISFELGRGEVLGIVGHNGSGKSTLLQIIAGVLQPTAGTVEVQGRVAALLELGAGFNPEFSGEENVFMNAQLLGLTEREARSKYQSIVDFADIGEFIDRPVKTYSSGMYVRLAFAVAAMVEPDVLIVDEALSVGDVRFQKKCIDRINELKRAGTTILFVSHSTEQVKRFCDHALWIDKGGVREIGDVAAVCDHYESYSLGNATAEADLTPSDTLAAPAMSQPADSDGLAPAKLTSTQVSKNTLAVFDEFKVELGYEVLDERVDSLLVGVAIRRAGDDLYLFGPNTALDRVHIPNHRGSHKVDYVIPRLQLLPGDYYVDAGIFTDNGLICMDYRSKVDHFTVQAEYFSEGVVYLDHQWVIHGDHGDEGKATP